MKLTDTLRAAKTSGEEKPIAREAKNRLPAVSYEPSSG